MPGGSWRTGESARRCRPGGGRRRRRGSGHGSAGRGSGLVWTRAWTQRGAGWGAIQERGAVVAGDRVPAQPGLITIAVRRARARLRRRQGQQSPWRALLGLRLGATRTKQPGASWTVGAGPREIARARGGREEYAELLEREGGQHADGGQRGLTSRWATSANRNFGRPAERRSQRRRAELTGHDRAAGNPHEEGKGQWARGCWTGNAWRRGTSGVKVCVTEPTVGVGR